MNSDEISPGYDIYKWRDEFPLLKHVVHLANCSQSPQSVRVRNAIEAYLNDWEERGMDWEKWMEAVEVSKGEYSKLIHARPHEISMHSSVSQATSSVASALDYWGERNKVVVTEADFPTVVFIWKACQKLGFGLEIVPVINGEIDPSSYEKTIDERTLITCVPHVYYQNGFKQNIGEISRIAHKKGSLIFVDAYQSLGTEPVDVKEMDIDILVAGNLKYLLGMPGSAYLYVKEALVRQMKPMATGWFGQENPFAFNIHDFRYARDGRRFDSGTPVVVTAYAARAGMQIINEIGVSKIKPWIDALSRYVFRAMEKRGLETTSPKDIAKKGAVTSIMVPDPDAVEVELKKRGIIASARGAVIRFAHHFFVTPQDIDRALDILEEILAETAKGKIDGKKS